jgi:hypothetical protein
MRIFAIAVLVSSLITIAGCGCLELPEDRLLRVGGGGPDPEQTEWNRFWFGTRYLPRQPGLPYSDHASAVLNQTSTPAQQSAD